MQYFVWLITLILGLFLGNYLPSYMKEKGKNLATKEDVTEITNKIESIKTDNAKDIERLKADLDLYIGQQSKREDVYKKVSLLIFEIIDLFQEIDINYYIENKYDVDIGTREMYYGLDKILTEKFKELKKIIFENNVFLKSNILDAILILIIDFEKNGIQYWYKIEEGFPNLKQDFDKDYFRKNILPKIKEIINMMRKDIDLDEFSGDFIERVYF